MQDLLTEAVGEHLHRVEAQLGRGVGNSTGTPS